jgi:hypothetical protein
MGVASAWGFPRRNLCRGAQRIVAASCTSLLIMPPAWADYWVYCFHSKIRIESRPPADVGRSYVASSLCTLGSFMHVSDARSFAMKNWKGEGQSCACR